MTTKGRPPDKGGGAKRRGVSDSIGIIGLGIMGSAMAANLAKAGFTVYGYDVVAARRAALKKSGGTPASSLARLARAAEVLITSLPSAKALHDVAQELNARGRVVMETSTLPIDEKERAREMLAKKGIVLLDCPLSGTGAQARAKDLVVYASGDRKAYAKAEPFMPGFSRAHHYLGAFGNGSKMKFVANLLVAIHNVSAAEAFVLGMKAGLPAETIFRVQADSAGSSRMFQVRGPMMVAGKYGEATMRNDLWQKDMKIIAEFAAKLGVPTPLFNASAAIYSATLSQGHETHDTAAVCAVLERMAGVRR
ncbi:MAG: NAD(P)-dependent oxidoreductase [Betaproteobacteria bacterium]|nr:NAD(P)-dependent oxidoreductase [Betaproteobacteria bacterium]